MPSFELLEILKRPEIHLPLVVGGSLVLSFIAQKVTTSILSRIVDKTSFHLDDALFRVLNRPVGISIFLTGCWIALGLCGLPEGITGVVERVLASIAILVWTFGLTSLSTIVIDALSARKDMFHAVQPQTRPLINLINKVVILGAALYFASITWNWDISAWLASAGILGIAVGFAAKDTLANFISGIFIVADRPYKVNDYVVLDNGQIRGRVTDIGVRSTRILTRDDVEVIVPNAVIGNGMIVNESGGPYEKFRVRVPVSVAYGSDVDQVESILMEIAAQADLVQQYPEPRVRFREMADSGLNFELLVWVARPELRGMALHDLNRTIYKTLGENKIEIPYPKRDIYVHNR